MSDEERDYEVEVLIEYRVRVGVVATSDADARQQAKDAVYSEPLEAFDVVDERIVETSIRSGSRGNR